ncbi:hypothetical protein MTR67_001586 [Solanum verrucosum]|uniref:Pentatricopeptide repeat-containing protein n=1 Tax=Solanum verrucosum TaxID=315347 RepID=A0AAF0PT18_SOLVR|nr:hypothetical protein MTR67_001586 [Solanum verrucosum]
MIETGGSLHSMAVKSGFGSDLHVNNTLLRMYAGFGVISNLPSDSLLLFQCMKLANEKPNCVTLVSLLGACTHILNIRLGKCIHSHIVTSGIELHVELETTLLGMYAKCGHIQSTLRIFKSMGDKNLQTWTIMISGLTDHGHEEEVVSLFARMEEFGFMPDSLSFSAILYACSHIGFVDAGREYFEKNGNDANSLRLAMKSKGINKYPGSHLVILPKEAVEGSDSNVSVYVDRRGNSDHQD